MSHAFGASALCGERVDRAGVRADYRATRDLAGYG